MGGDGGLWAENPIQSGEMVKHWCKRDCGSTLVKLQTRFRGKGHGLGGAKEKGGDCFATAAKPVEHKLQKKKDKGTHHGGAGKRSVYKRGGGGWREGNRPFGKRHTVIIQTGNIKSRVQLQKRDRRT